MKSNPEIAEVKSRAESGDAEAQYQLGYRYYRGKGCEKDYGESFKWFRCSAEQGHGKAQAALGKSYTWGVGVLKNFKLAFPWLKKAEAQLEDTYARFFLALAHLNGWGCEQNPEEAIRLLKKGAMLGCYSSMGRLSELYRAGEKGVQWELKKAYVWAILAARYCDNMQKEYYCQKRDECEIKIFPWDAAEGKKMADELAQMIPS